jgi:hypothetical protein
MNASMIIAAGLTLLLSAAVPRPAAGQEQIGVLTLVNGEWERDHRAGPVASGTRVFRSDTFRIRSSYMPGKYLVVLFNDGRRVQFSCTHTVPCRPVVPTDSLLSNSLPARVGRLADRVRTGAIALFSGDHRRYSYGISRQGRLITEDAVLAITDRGVDVGPVLMTAPAGGYRVTLLHLPSPLGAQGASTDTAVLAWQPSSGSAVAAVRPVREGLYMLEVLSGNSPAADSSWVLLVRAGTAFDRAAAEFRAARDLTGTWSGAGQGEVRAFLRATLDFLCRETFAEGKSVCGTR